ncbi:DUF2188 domain-containing protein [Oerskovia sp. NPDC060338]|jgi:hypothetical protein|uniref:DUF2188 domain-containing protein n=1 Tax=unclassified Oerskovia TaxID=2619021 RepID=UPI0036557EC1
MFPKIETFHEDSRWKNRRAGTAQVFAVFDTKAEAVLAGRDTALREGAEHVVRDAGGRIEQIIFPGQRPWAGTG